MAPSTVLHLGLTRFSIFLILMLFVILNFPHSGPSASALTRFDWLCPFNGRRL
jgi:hypothetical protein